MGAKLLLLHGFFSCHDAWEPLRRALPPEVQPVAPDLLGWGSECDERDGGLENVAAHLQPLIEREQPTHLLGHSMGGIVALAVAARNPGCFERIGIAGLPVYYNRRDGAEHQYRRGFGFRLLLHSDALAHRGCVAVRRARPLWEPFTRPFLGGRTAPAVCGAFSHSRGGHEDLNAIVFGNHVERLADEVRDPVVLLHGGRDRAAPVERAEALAARHGWPFTLEPGHGHQAVMDHPWEVAQWVVRDVLGWPLALGLQPSRRGVQGVPLANRRPAIEPE